MEDLAAAVKLSVQVLRAAENFALIEFSAKKTFFFYANVTFPPRSIDMLVYTRDVLEKSFACVSVCKKYLWPHSNGCLDTYFKLEHDDITLGEKFFSQKKKVGVK